MRFLSYFKRTLTSVVKRSIRKFGYELVSDSSLHMTMDGGIARLVSRQINIKTVIDVGASNGRWSELCMKHFANADYLLFEAQEEYGSALEKFKKQSHHIDFVLKVVSNASGPIYFDDSIVGGGIASREQKNEHFKMKTACTIDEEVQRRRLAGPFFIKLDTHGFEVPILEGATNCLKDANAVLIECYNFRLNDNALKFSEMVQYMEKKGFYPADIVDLSLREKDSMLWQMDIFFLRADRKEFTDNSYQ
jgi:FkbM family methyltransferase